MTGRRDHEATPRNVATVHPIRPQAHLPFDQNKQRDEFVTLPALKAQLIASLIKHSDIDEPHATEAIAWLTGRGRSLNRHPSIEGDPA